MCHNIYELQPPTNIFLPAGGGNVLIIIILPPSRSDLKFTEDSWDNMSYVVEESLPTLFFLQQWKYFKHF